MHIPEDQTNGPTEMKFGEWVANNRPIYRQFFNIFTFFIANKHSFLYISLRV